MISECARPGRSDFPAWYRRKESCIAALMDVAVAGTDTLRIFSYPRIRWIQPRFAGAIFCPDNANL